MAARSGEVGVGWCCAVASSISVSMALGGSDRGVAVRDTISVLNCSTAVVSIVLSSAISDLITMDESTAVSMALDGGAWVVTGDAVVAVLNCSTAEVINDLRSLISLRSDRISEA